MKAEMYKPSGRLSKYIDNYMLVDIDWSQTESVSSVWRLIPFGQVSMLFLYGDSHEYSLTGPENNMQKTRKAFIVGQLTKPIWLRFSGHTRLVKIQFKSIGMQQLLPFNMHEFTNVPSLDLEAVWGASVHHLLEQLYSAGSDQQRIGFLNSFLEARLLPQSDMVDYVDYTITQINQSMGNLSIHKMEDQLGISNRHLERLFRKKVGLTPKELSKIVRLNCALKQLNEGKGNSLTSVSHSIGYFDQAHFSRDFKAITGIPPSKLLSPRSSELFVTHGKCFTSQPVKVTA